MGGPPGEAQAAEAMQVRAFCWCTVASGEPALALGGEAGEAPPTLCNTRWPPISIETEDDGMQAFDVTTEIAARKSVPWWP